MPCQAAYKTGDRSSSGADVGIDTLQPGLWVPAGAPFVQQISAGFAATRAGAHRFVCPRAMTISKIGFVLAVAATADDGCDVGIYSADGNTLLGSSGATLGVMNGALGVKIVNLQAPVQLSPNTIYYAALAYGTIGGTVAQVVAAAPSSLLMSAFGAAMPAAEICYRDNRYPLTAPFAPFGVTTNVAIMGLQA